MRAFQDQSDIVGDLGLRPASVVAESYPLDPLEDAIMPGLNAESPVNNAAIHVTVQHVTVQPMEKYKTMAASLASMHPKGGTATILGDHPGTLARALICRDIAVVGIDPQNSDHIEDPDGDASRYEQKCGKVRITEQDFVIETANGGRILINASDIYVVDTSNDDERAEEATARNLHIACAIKIQEGPTVTTAFENFWSVSDLPVRLASVIHSAADDPIVVPGTTEDPVVRGGNARHWYQFVVSRAFMYADRAARSGLAGQVRGATDPLHLLARWERYLGHQFISKPALLNLSNLHSGSFDRNLAQTLHSPPTVLEIVQGAF